MRADEGSSMDLDLGKVRYVLAAAQMTRRVFSAEALKDLQPAPERGSKVKQLKPSGAQALFLLTIKPGLTAKEIAKELSISQPAVSFAITRLMEGKFVRSWIDEDDKRVRHHEATDAGRDCIRRILDNASVS